MTATEAQVDVGPDATDPDGPARQPLPVAVWAIGLATAALSLPRNPAYGLNQDALYSYSLSRRLDFGYVHPPPLHPMIVRALQAVVGDVNALWVHPALMAGVVVVVGAHVARVLGGSRRAQVVTAVACAVAPAFVLLGHGINTMQLDQVLWGLATAWVVQMARGAHPRLWVAVGLAIGVGFLNRPTILVWVLVAGVALLSGPGRGLLRTSWLLAGVAAAGAVVSPTLIWQALHGWPSVDYGESWLSGSAWASRVPLLALVLIVSLTPAVVVPFVRLRPRLRDDPVGRGLAVGLAAFVTFLVVLGAADKTHFILIPALVLVPLAVVRLEDGAGPRRRRATYVGFVLWSIVVGLVGSPVLPPRVLESTGADQVFSLDTWIGYDVLPEQVAAVTATLPPDERADAVVVAKDYGSAGALDLWGDELGIPPVISGHDGWYQWGWAPATERSTIVSVGYTRAEADLWFRSCRTAAVVQPPAGLERSGPAGQPILVCQGTIDGWPDTWPLLRRFDN